MLTLRDRGPRFCDGMTRREVLHIGGLGALGLAMVGAIQRLHGGAGALPAGVRLPHRIFNTDGSVWPGQDAGFLGRNADPWLLRCEPGSPNYRIDEFSLSADVPLSRLESRHGL